MKISLPRNTNRPQKITHKRLHKTTIKINFDENNGP